jgi:isopenicillin-N N-acyltransferase-like protein
MSKAHRGRSRWWRRLAIAAGVVIGVPLAAHVAIGCATALEAPPVVVPELGEVAEASGVRRLGSAYARKRGEVLEVRLAGSPEAIGQQMGRLLRPEMVAIEDELLGQFRHFVPLSPVRALIVDVARLRFRGADQGMADLRRREIASQSLAFQPDPFADFLPTYHRFVFLHALYDVSLSFEHSPLLGCSSFVARGDATEGGRVLLARNFDFEAGPSFDRGKALFLVFEEGRIPYASVSWPGFVGSVTGMNAEGVALVVHGGRAREVVPGGEPVPHTMREVLARARTVEEAITIFRERAPMVSHMVLVADAAGDAAVVERAPGVDPHVRRAAPVLALTNHFEGPLAADEKNRSIEAGTSTLARRARLDEVLASPPAKLDAAGAVSILRDKRAAGGGELALGDRRALEALIATHAIVADATERALWVSEGPHLAGRFLRFDLRKLLDPSFAPGDDEPLVTLPADPILDDGRLEDWRRAGSPHGGEPAAGR